MAIYINSSWLYQDSNEDAKLLLKAFTGRDCVPTEGSTGQGEECQEGDLGFYDAETGDGYTVSYGFALDPTGEAEHLELLYSKVVRDEGWDTNTTVRFDDVIRILDDIEKYHDTYDSFTINSIRVSLYGLRDRS